MAQIFHRSTNTLSRVSIFGAVFFVAGALWLLAAITRSGYVTGQDVAREQPVQFSHEHHVGELGIDCRYCHTSVEISAVASDSADEDVHELPLADLGAEPVPRARARELAHRPVDPLDQGARPARLRLLQPQHPREQGHRLRDLPRTRRHDEPLYQATSLQMEWCLDCHRHPERSVRPREEVFNMRWEPPDDQNELAATLMKAYDIHPRTDCSTCHR